MKFPIEVFDTKLASQELFDKVMFLPYMCTRTDDPPCPEIVYNSDPLPKDDCFIICISSSYL